MFLAISIIRPLRRLCPPQFHAINITPCPAALSD
jgi:hypothetical protein